MTSLFDSLPQKIVEILPLIVKEHILCHRLRKILREFLEEQKKEGKSQAKVEESFQLTPNAIPSVLSIGGTSPKIIKLMEKLGLSQQVQKAQADVTEIIERWKSQGDIPAHAKDATVIVMATLEAWRLLTAKKIGAFALGLKLSNSTTLSTYLNGSPEDTETVNVFDRCQTWLKILYDESTDKPKNENSEELCFDTWFSHLFEQVKELLAQEPQGVVPPQTEEPAPTPVAPISNNGERRQLEILLQGMKEHPDLSIALLKTLVHEKIKNMPTTPESVTALLELLA